MSNQKAKQYALSLLAKREYPRYKLACKLQEKGFSFQCTETVLDELYQLGWQSDWRYVAQKIRHQLNCYRGPERIYAYLKREQVDPEIIDHILDDFDVDWYEQARRAYQKKFGDRPLTSLSLKEKQKRLRYLAGQGFDFDQCQSVFHFDDE